MRYRTREGDVVDAICYQFYNSSSMTPDVYAANPGLSKYDPVLPGGLLIQLPERKESGQLIQKTISLSD